MAEINKLDEATQYRMPAAWQTIVYAGSPEHKLLLAKPINMSSYSSKICIVDPDTGQALS